MSMMYSDFTTALGVLLQYPITNAASATPSSNTDFNNFLPRIIEGAEQRIYRELDFIATRKEDATVSLTAGSRNATLPTEIIVLESANYITPAGSQPSAGTRNPMLVIAKQMLDQIWPTEGSTAPPEYLAQLSNTDVQLAPTPDQNYVLECVGIFRPTPLSATNTSTYISLNYPDLMLNAAMVVSTGYQRDFGAQSDDPKMAMSWENLYQISKQSTMDEEQRRKHQGGNWSAYSATPNSTPRP